MKKSKLTDADIVVLDKMYHKAIVAKLQIIDDQFANASFWGLAGKDLTPAQRKEMTTYENLRTATQQTVRLAVLEEFNVRNSRR